MFDACPKKVENSRKFLSPFCLSGRLVSWVGVAQVRFGLRVENALAAAVAVASVVATAVNFHLPFSSCFARDGISFGWPFACDSYSVLKFAAVA